MLTYAKPCAISPGEAVLVKIPFTVSKGETAYDPNLMIVVGKKGSMITAGNENSTVTRHTSFFKSLDNQPSTLKMISSLTVVSTPKGKLTKSASKKLQPWLLLLLKILLITNLISWISANPYQRVKFMPLILLVNNCCAGLLERGLLGKFLTCSLELLLEPPNFCLYTFV